MDNENINIAVRGHETLADGWECQKLAEELYRFVDLFNREYFLNALPLPILTFKQMRHNNLGHFLLGRNDIGAQYEININRKHANIRPLLLTLSTLLHEMCHLAQFAQPEEYGEGTGRHHNKAFIELTTSFGIPSNGRGVTQSIDDNFIEFCVKNGVEKPTARELAINTGTPKGKGESKLKKYTCKCGYNIRVAREGFSATCNLCNTEFEPQ